MLLRHLVFLSLCAVTHGQVVINEMASASSDRLLQWTANGQPRLGTGIPWHDRAFTDAGWSIGALPAGWGSTVSTNLQSAMQNRTPSAYFRKTFTVSQAQSELTFPVLLQVEANDGFVAFINGVEVARANAGAKDHFIYAAQPAYNAATASGLTEFTLPAANSLLVPGDNVLAIQVLNKDLTSSLRLNAGLRLTTSNTPVPITEAFYDFNPATGATKTRQRTGTTDSNSSSGVPISGGWLASANDPTTTGTWTSLNIVSGEIPGIGTGGSGALRYSIAQTGANGTAAWLRAPVVSMTNSWVTGALSPASLAATTLSFRYRTAGGLQFGLRMDPAIGQEAQSADGFPIIGLPIGGTPDYTWATASGGTMTRGINATGSPISQTAGSINAGNYEISYVSTATNWMTVIRENNTAGQGPGGSTGIFTGLFDPWPATLTSLYLGIKGMQVSEWPVPALSPPTSITAAHFDNTRISFQWKLPAGRQMLFALDENGTNLPSARAVLGTFTGTGNWETFNASLGSLVNANGLRSRLNGSLVRSTLKLTMHYVPGFPFASGEKVEVDDLNLYYESPGQTLEENMANSFATASGGNIVRNVSGAGAGSNATTGTLANTITPFHDPGVTGMSFRIIEDPGPGSDAGPGHLRCEVTDTPDTGAPWGFSIPGPTVRNWTKGAISVSQLSDVSLQLSTKIPTGVSVQLYAEPLGGSASSRANLGTLVGTGSWQTESREFATAGNIESLRDALNSGNTTQFQLTFVFPMNPSTGDQLGLDQMQILPWRTYSSLLSGGTAANQQRFLDYLNANSQLTFIPTFIKNSVAPETGGTLTIDNFQVTFFGLDPNNAQVVVPNGAAGWKYFVGLAEPSGGLFDAALLNGFPIPPGEEEEYDNPQNFRDWLELFNSGNSPANIGGWALSDDSDLPMKWTFPAGTTIPPGGFLVVLCDGRDEANGTGNFLHTNFSLSAAGEAVRLRDAAGVVQSAATNIPEQDAFHSWGRNPNGDGSYGFLDTATPGAANIGAFYSSRVKTPDFVAADGITPMSGGFYSASQTLLLTCETPDAIIRYTTDGSEPSETNGTTYSGPISVTPTGDGKTARSYRARAFRAGLLPSEAKVRSFLIGQNANLSGVPALLFNGNAGRNFYLPHGVLAILGGTYSGEIWAPNGPNSYNIPINRGDAYERMISAEWYYPDGKDGWRDNVGIRVSSSPYSRPRLLLDNTAASPWTSDHRHKPSFNLKWREDYGSEGFTDPNLIPGNDVTTYRELRIRAGKNDIIDPFIIDEVSRRLYRDMGWFSPIGTIATVYINGSFKGFFNPTERLRQSMFQAHYRTESDFDVRYIGEQVDGDATFWNQMVTALNAHNASPNATTYAAALNYIDPVNVADYFLCNIYINCDDWPGNNWGAQRERSASGRYRLVMWDAEAAWSRFGLAVNYNTIDNKVLQNTECSNCFRFLFPNPEFKLLVADRIQKHFFNNGVLDDRNTASSALSKHINFFKSKVDPVLRFVTNNAGESVNLDWYTNHINPTTGRRAYLFGTAAGSFSNKGLWPATVPAAFSQHGGIVASNYPLVITSPSGGTIYYTLDGSDPRLAGGTISPGAQVYSGAINLNTLGTVKARVRSASGEWSALTEAYFQPGAITPTSSSIIVSEINYHPPAPTSAEEALGFTDADDFEFLRLTNIGTEPLDLRALQFTAGLTYNFATSTIPALPAGGHLLLVKRRAAFEARYGTSFGALIGGEYAGSLSNGGELLRIDNFGTVTTPVVALTYQDDSAPSWPATPDGFGPSLVLKNPHLAPNPSLGENWLASAQPGGLPGGVVRLLNYTSWKNLSFDPDQATDNLISGMVADPDADGLPNLIEYGLGGNPMFNDRAALLSPPRIENVGGNNHLAYDYRLNIGASDVSVTPQVSSTLSSWFSGSLNLTTTSGPTLREDGVNLYSIRDNTPASAGSRFIRLRMVAP